jgi:hypothetical protein
MSVQTLLQTCVVEAEPARPDGPAGGSLGSHSAAQPASLGQAGLRQLRFCRAAALGRIRCAPGDGLARWPRGRVASDDLEIAPTPQVQQLIVRSHERVAATVDGLHAKLAGDVRRAFLQRARDDNQVIEL